MGSSFSIVDKRNGCKENVKESDRGKNVRIVYCYIALKKLFFLGPNHWSVILKLDNGQFVCIQKHDDGYVHCYVRESLRAASILTWGKDGDDVRLSDYGPCNYSWNKLYNDIDIHDSYSYFFDDCQNYSRQLINKIADKSVGWWPLEDGPVYRNIRRAYM